MSFKLKEDRGEQLTNGMFMNKPRVRHHNHSSHLATVVVCPIFFPSEKDLSLPYRSLMHTPSPSDWVVYHLTAYCLYFATVPVVDLTFGGIPMEVYGKVPLRQQNIAMEVHGKIPYLQQNVTMEVYGKVPYLQQNIAMEVHGRAP